MPRKTGHALSNKERKLKYNEKLRADPIRYEKQKEKERERWQERVQKKKVTLIADLSERGKRSKRREWKNSQQKCRLRKKAAKDILSPPTSPESNVQDLDESLENIEAQAENIEVQVEDIEPQAGPSGDQRREAGRKRVRRNRSRTVQELKRTKEELARTKEALQKGVKKVNRYKVQASRLRKKLQLTVDTPTRRANKLIDAVRSPDRLVNNMARRQLLYHQAIVKGLQLKRKDSKKLENIISQKIVKKYRMAKWLKRIVGIDARCIHDNKKKSGRKELPLAHRKHVKAYFERDDVSRITAGKKCTITRYGIKKQRRYLLQSLCELHTKYCATYRHLNISYAAFCRLRPFWVLFPRASDRDTCNCQRCENMTFMLTKLNTKKVINTNDLVKLTEGTYCSLKQGKVSPQCLNSECPNSCPRPLTTQDDEINWDENVSWPQWINKTIDSSDRRDGTGKSMSVRVTEKETKNGSLKQLLDEFVEMFEHIGRRHVLNSLHQFSIFRELKSKISPNEVIIHVDFAENYSCKYHTEVQSVHFGASRDQATIHDGVVYINDKPSAFATISNSLRHDPEAIWFYLHPVLKWILEQNPGIKGVHFISDGPTTQYKNKTHFFLLTTLYKTEFPAFEVLTWNYSGAGHGKSPADGVGASVKRSADQIVANGTDIPNAKALFDLLIKRDQSSVKLFYVPACELEEGSKHVPASLQTVPGTMKIHQVMAGRKFMTYRELGCYCSYPEACECFAPKRHDFANEPENAEAEPQDLNVGDESLGTPAKLVVGQWVIVTYDNTPYPGVVKEHSTQSDDDEEEVLVKAMRQKGNNAFNWPITEDCLPYSREEILSLIETPKKGRRHYSLTKADWEKFQSLL